MATAQASATSSGPGRRSTRSRVRTMRPTCGWAGPPWPAIDSFTCMGVYSATSRPERARAQRATPRASPTRMAVVRLVAKKSCSTAATSGRCEATSPSRAAKSAVSRRGLGVPGRVSMQPAWTRRSAPGSPSTTATPVLASPGSTPRTLMRRRGRSPDALEDVVGDLGVGVDLLHVVVVLEGVEKAEHGGRLLGVELDRVGGRHRHLGRGDLPPLLLHRAARLLEEGGRHGDLDGPAVDGDVDRVEHLEGEFLGVAAVGLDVDDPLLAEHPGDAARLPQRAAAAGEEVAQRGHRAIAVVGEH